MSEKPFTLADVRAAVATLEAASVKPDADGCVWVCTRCGEWTSSEEAAYAHATKAHGSPPYDPNLDPTVRDGEMLAGRPKALLFYRAVLELHRLAQLRAGQNAKALANRARLNARWAAADEFDRASLAANPPTTPDAEARHHRALNDHLATVENRAHLARRFYVDAWEAERLALPTATKPCDICPSGAGGGPHEDWCPAGKPDPAA